MKKRLLVMVILKREKPCNEFISPVFSPSLIKAAVVMSENPRVRLSPELETCLRIAGRKAYYKACNDQNRRILLG